MSALLIPVKMVVCVLIITGVIAVTVTVLATKETLVNKVSDIRDFAFFVFERT